MRFGGAVSFLGWRRRINRHERPLGAHPLEAFAVGRVEDAKQFDEGEHDRHDDGDYDNFLDVGHGMFECAAKPGLRQLSARLRKARCLVPGFE